LPERYLRRWRAAGCQGGIDGRPKARIVGILDPPVRQSAGRGLSWTIYTKSPEGFSGLLVADDQQNEESNRKKAPGVPGL